MKGWLDSHGWPPPGIGCQPPWLDKLLSSFYGSVDGLCMGLKFGWHKFRHSHPQHEWKCRWRRSYPWGSTHHLDCCLVFDTTSSNNSSVVSSSRQQTAFKVAVSFINDIIKQYWRAYRNASCFGETSKLGWHQVGLKTSCWSTICRNIWAERACMEEMCSSIEQSNRFRGFFGLWNCWR